MAKAISEEIREQALDLFKKGYRSWTIAKQLNVARSTVKKWQYAFDRNDYGWTSSKRKKRTESEALLAVNLYTELGSYSAVAAELGMSHADVRRFVFNVTNHDMPILPKGRNARDRIKALSKSREQGDVVMSKRKSKHGSKPGSTAKKGRRNDDKVMLVCLLAAIEKCFDDDNEAVKKRSDFMRSSSGSTWNRGSRYQTLPCLRNPQKFLLQKN